jgi:hypothetical protein
MSTPGLLARKETQNFNYTGVRECELRCTVAFNKVNKIPAKYTAHISTNLWAI